MAIYEEVLEYAYGYVHSLHALVVGVNFKNLKIQLLSTKMSDIASK